jgi:hypothetical protein
VSDVSIYRRSDQIYVVPAGKTATGLIVDAPPSAVVPSGVDAPHLGACVSQALSESRGLVLDGPAVESLLKLAGVRSLSQFMRGAESVHVSEDDGVVVVSRLHNRGRGGFAWTDTEYRVPPGDAGMLGTAVLSALPGPSPEPEEPVSDSAGDPSPIRAEELDSAAEWMSEALRSSGYVADFSPASLREVERFFREQMDEPGVATAGGLLDEDVGRRLFGLGAYVGEVLRRARGGRWSTEGLSSEEEDLVVLELDESSLVWPVRRVVDRFRRGSEEDLVFYGASLGLDVGPRPRRRSFWRRSR